MKRSFSKAWREMRTNHLLTYPECRACGYVAPNNHVHHLRYRGKRGLSERPGDLMTLCADCHNHLHRLHPRGGVGPVQTLAFIADKQASLDGPDLTWIV